MSILRRSRVFEFFVIATVVGVILLIAFSRYLDLGRETRRMAFEVLAHHFTTGLAGMRVQWILQKVHAAEKEYLDLNRSRIYFSPGGWPTSIDRPLVSVEGELTATDCAELWRAVLQNSSPVSVENEHRRGLRRYHVTLADPGVCRYELVTRKLYTYYFDYSPMSGQVTINVPYHRKISEM